MGAVRITTTIKRDGQGEGGGTKINVDSRVEVGGGGQLLLCVCLVWFNMIIVFAVLIVFADYKN